MREENGRAFALHVDIEPECAVFFDRNERLARFETQRCEDRILVVRLVGKVDARQLMA